MNLLFFYKFFNLTLFALLGNFRSTSRVTLASATLISLYNTTDKITILNNDNFLSTVYPSKTAWLIEFYASWCGHCVSYANIYREVAINTYAWKTIVRIGAINCYTGQNAGICRQYNVRQYPKLKLIPPNAILEDKSNVIDIPATDAKYVEIELIKGLGNLNKGNRTWPRFIPVNRVTLEELYARIPKSIKLLLVIVEKRDDFTGRQIMLDFSKYYNEITIFRMTTDGRSWRKFHLNQTDVPALYVILRNRTAERLNPKQNLTTNIDYRHLFNDAIRLYIHEKKSSLLINFDNDDLQEIIQNNNALKDIQIQQQQQLIKIHNNLTDDIRDKDTIYNKKINIIDLELVLSYMFRQEIPQYEDIKGEAYDALSQWLTILIKYFPGREPVMKYLNYVLAKIYAHSKDLNGNKFREIIDMKTSKAYLPNTHKQYQHCSGSLPQYRGYPCALWLLFHTLTISQYKQAILDSSPINVIEIPMAVKNYVKFFFSCRKCSEHFMKETQDINRLNLTNKYEAILYLWKIHNHVNQRLRYDITEDPKHPKVQFPSKYLCENCQLKNNEYDYSKTIDFLVEYYSKENFDTSSLLLLSSENKDFSNQSQRIISKIEYIDQSGFFTRIISRYSMYIFFGLLIFLIIIRRRYCKTKRKRYTI